MTIGTTPNYGSTLTRMLREVGPPRLKELGNTMAPYKKAIGTKNRQGENVIKRIKNGGNYTFGFYADGATTPDGVAVGSGSYTLLGKLFHGALQVNLGAAIQANGKAQGSANLLLEEIDSAGKYAGRALNHALIHGDGSIALPSGAAAAIEAIMGGSSESAAITLEASTQMFIGQGLDIYQGSTLVAEVYVSTLTPNFVSGTHTFKVKDTGLTADSFTPDNTEVAYIRGAKDNGVTGLVDVVGSGDLYGQTVTTPGWASSEVDAGGAIAEADLRDALVATRHKAGNGAGPKFLLMNEHRLNDLYETRNSNVRYGNDGEVTIGDYKTMDRVAGLPVVIDESCPNTTIFGVDSDAITCAVFHDMFQLGDGKPGTDFGQGHFFKPRNKLAYEAELVGMYETEVDCRHTSFKITGITN